MRWIGHGAAGSACEDSTNGPRARRDERLGGAQRERNAMDGGGEDGVGEDDLFLAQEGWERGREVDCWHRVQSCLSIRALLSALDFWVSTRGERQAGRSCPLSVLLR